MFAFGLYLVYRTAYRNWGELILILSFSTTAIRLRQRVFLRRAVHVAPREGDLRSRPPSAPGFTLSSIPFLLEVAILIGAFHLASGYAIAFVNQERAGNYLDAFLDRLPTIVLYVFLIPFGFAVAGTALNFGVLFTSTAPTPIFNNLLGLDIPIATTARVSSPGHSRDADSS